MVCSSVSLLVLFCGGCTLGDGDRHRILSVWKISRSKQEWSSIRIRLELVCLLLTTINFTLADEPNWIWLVFGSYTKIVRRTTCEEENFLIGRKWNQVQVHHIIIRGNKYTRPVLSSYRYFSFIYVSTTPCLVAGNVKFVVLLRRRRMATPMSVHFYFRLILWFHFNGIVSWRDGQSWYYHEKCMYLNANFR